MGGKNNELFSNLLEQRKKNKEEAKNYQSKIEKLEKKIQQIKEFLRKKFVKGKNPSRISENKS